jgi:hypothetical protein
MSVAHDGASWHVATALAQLAVMHAPHAVQG